MKDHKPTPYMKDIVDNLDPSDEKTITVYKPTCLGFTCYIPRTKTTIYTKPKYRRPFYWIIAGIISIPVILLIALFLMEAK